MGEHADAIIAVLSTIILGSIGFFLSRTLDKIDENIEKLWNFATESREDRFELSERITRLESQNSHRGK